MKNRPPLLLIVSYWCLIIFSTSSFVDASVYCLIGIWNGVDSTSGAASANGCTSCSKTVITTLSTIKVMRGCEDSAFFNAFTTITYNSSMKTYICMADGCNAANRLTKTNPGLLICLSVIAAFCCSSPHLYRRIVPAVSQWSNALLVLLFCLAWQLMILVPAVESCSTSSPASITPADVSQQSPLVLPTPLYNATTAVKSPTGSCGHNKYWNSGEAAGGIVGGRQALVNEFPWQVIIETPRLFCGGSVISANYVITAGHCLNGVNTTVGIRVSFDVYSKSSTRTTTRTISAYYLHPNYTTYLNVSINDIAILKLSSAVSFTTWNIQPICLPKSCDDACQPGQYGVVSGWGVYEVNGTQPDILRTGTFLVIPTSDCAAVYYDTYVYSNAICAGTESSATCSGDSGGAFGCFKNGYFVQSGIVSNGLSCSTALRNPSVLTRVCVFVSWINSIITTSSG